MTAKEKTAQGKLYKLQLAEELVSVSKACKIMGYSRSQFYKIKRAFQPGGLEALLDRPPIPASFPTR
ncbi:MAG: helix-turn-helix domain-containing protein [Actinobacteria bacterium]|nr:helix-turn-helix domain-containing protein [Actinomycetota bacterium]